ncbi:MAG: glycosyltransferase [Phycisphaeraceae bacterium]
MSGNAFDTVSVVMPCYNGAQYLAQAMDSALAQTHRPIEILIVDDGSKDNSAELVRKYERDFPDRGIRLIQQPNAGEPAARNTGIFASKGTWVAQLDTDDWWEPPKLAMQLEAARKAGDDCVLVHTGVVGHLPDGKLNPSPAVSNRVGWCTKALLDPTSIGHPSIMVRKDALEKIGGYDPDFKQACDIDLYFRLSAIGTFVHVPDRLLHYRYHAGQMSASPVKQIRFHHRAVRKFFEQHPEKLAEIGPDYVSAKLAEHVGVKLESLYWRRNLPGFRELLAYADENKLDNDVIRAWRKRARWPNWVIRLKDRLTGGRKA